MNKVIVVIALLLASISFAKVPAEITRTAGYKSARAILKECNSSEDAMQCLKDKGAVCLPAADKDAETYRCEMEVSIEATEQRPGSHQPELVGKYTVTYLLTNSKKAGQEKRSRSSCLMTKVPGSACVNPGATPSSCEPGCFVPNRVASQPLAGDRLFLPSRFR